MLGEGFDSNHNFCFADYAADNRFGFFYNCSQSQWFQPYNVSPKHAAATYAALSYILKGYVSEGRITSRLNGSQWGYKYKDTWDPGSTAVIYAVWDRKEFFSSPLTLNLDETTGTVTVYDIVGNEVLSQPNTGSIDLTITDNVLYVKVEP